MPHMSPMLWTLMPTMILMNLYFLAVMMTFMQPPSMKLIMSKLMKNSKWMWP